MAKAKPKPNPSLPPQPVMSPYMPRPMGAVGWSPMTTSAGVSPSSFNLFSPRPPPAPGSYSPYKSTPIPGAPGAIKYSPMTPSGSTTGSPATTNPYAYPYRPYTTTAPTLGASLPGTSATSSGTSSPFPAPPGPPAHKYTGRYYGVSTADGQTFRPPIYSTTGGPSPYSLNPTVRPPGVASGAATGSPGLGAIGSPGSGGTGAVVRPTTSYPLTTLPPLPRVPPTPAGVKPIPVPVPAMGGDQSASRALPPKPAGSGTVADIAKASTPVTANPTPSPAPSAPPAKK
ncbi:hypothetical protein DL93DRAFT_2070660 [Clavulina sp. PMI_390]|nr:hypothetical protein DL93DRAFT_2070660 [Clavulina sp. PMI_390]